MPGDAPCNNHPVDGSHPELREAIRHADVVEVARLIGAGADIHYRDENGYSAAIDVAYSGSESNEALIGVLELLIRNGVDLDAASLYNESALSVMSLFGRFDGVRLLLNAGADPSPLGWTPLIEAVAIGAIDIVRREAVPEVLEAVDRWSRTAWLVALQIGDREKAQLLLDLGADPNPRVERLRPPLFFAVDAGRADLVRWLIDLGQSADSPDANGDSALHHAVGRDEVECVDALIDAGASASATKGFDSVLAQASSIRVVRRLVAAGADPADLSLDGARALCRLEGGLEVLVAVTADQFEQGRSRRFGVSNPERISEPFWDAMIRSGVSANEGRAALGFETEREGPPTWCANRFGQSTTEFADERVIQIGGEHEDFYDADFCIYNDVIVHSLDGKIEIFGYPEDVFPPTDFHTATLVGQSIYVIGSLGYRGTRRFNETPVYRLDLGSMRMERLTPTGNQPGWIYKHRADLISPGAIRVTGGIRAYDDGQNPNNAEFILNLETLQWR
jgi:ankyrin repeat protein